MSTAAALRRTLRDELIAELERDGPITFARFMRRALYHPRLGYYAARPAGARGDYRTAPMAHPAFGALLAIQLHQMWRELGEGPFRVVEIGAADGLLARDIATYAERHLPQFAARLRYEACDSHPPPDGQLFNVRPPADLLPGGRGCIISNELFDALPTHRFEVVDGAVREVFIAARGGQLREVLDEPSDPRIGRRLEGTLERLPNQYRGEVCLELERCVAQLARLEIDGYAITIDYGRERADLYAPERSAGTLRAYRAHTLMSDPLNAPGECDLTADVDLTALEEGFARHRFQPLGATTQARFLRNLGLAAWEERVGRAALPQRERLANRAALRSLAELDGMGAFRVHLHRRGAAPRIAPRGLGGGGQAEELPAPLLADYPGRAYQQDSWSGFGSYAAQPRETF